ncbi:MAG TPA: tetratricopeptide repeat protein, partial [Bacteroidetes bacterium]|nr:tetratricopeptide repeat protein [Bacteroidota bacterium]
MMNLKRQITFISYFIVIQISFGQDAKITGTKLIDSYLSNGEFVRADSALQQQIARLKSQQLTDSLIDYIYYIGKVKLKLSNTSQATKAVTEFTDGIKASTVKPRLLRQLYLELGSFYNLIGNPQKAYESNLTALDYTVKIKNATGEDFGLVHSNMGTYAKYIGNLHLALQHHRKALKYYESWPGTEKSSLYITYNSLGGMMWFSSKIDSALYYYKLAGSVLKELPQTPLNKYFRPAMLNNNIAAIYGSQGNMEKAMQSMKSTINNWISFLNSEASDDKKESGKNAYYQAIENYAGLYKDLGDYQKAKDLLSY